MWWRLFTGQGLTNYSPCAKSSYSFIKKIAGTISQSHGHLLSTVKGFIATNKTVLCSSPQKQISLVYKVKKYLLVLHRKP